MQSDVSSQRASPTVVGGQTGAKPAAFAGVATRKGRAYARTLFSRIKWETKWGRMKIPRCKINQAKSILKKKLEDSHYLTSRFTVKLE